MAVWWGCISRRGKRQKQGRGGTDEQPLSDEPALIRCGEIYSTGSSNLNLNFSGSQKTFCVKKIKEK